MLLLPKIIAWHCHFLKTILHSSSAPLFAVVVCDACAQKIQIEIHIACSVFVPGTSPQSSWNATIETCARMRTASDEIIIMYPTIKCKLMFKYPTNLLECCFNTLLTLMVRTYRFLNGTTFAILEFECMFTLSFIFFFSVAPLLIADLCEFTKFFFLEAWWVRYTSKCRIQNFRCRSGLSSRCLYQRKCIHN